MGAVLVAVVSVDGRYGVSGAQPSELIAEVLQKAWEESSPLSVVGGRSSAPGCEGDACAV